MTASARLEIPRFAPEFAVHIVRASDGAEVVDGFAEYGDPSWGANEYWWTEGNMACDCNRGANFEDGGDECGDARYRIYVINKKTGALLYDERKAGA